MKVERQYKDLEHYQHMHRAVACVRAREKNTVTMPVVAEEVGLMPSELHQVCMDWVGISFEAFYPYLCEAFYKERLRKKELTLFDLPSLAKDTETLITTQTLLTIHPLHWEAQNKEVLEKTIDYNFYTTPLGNVLVASTTLGVCYLVFVTTATTAEEALFAQFPGALFQKKNVGFHEQALAYFSRDNTSRKPLILHLKGTPFQLKVWQNLLTIPTSQLTTYGAMATALGQPTASRAVGTAIGQNAVAYLIPCHRVVQATGKLGGYRWGITQKALLIAWEQTL